MANTTNYNWETPDDTDLVKDGALAIRTLGSSIDTTTKALNPSTTLGDIEYRSSTANTNTRLAIGTTGQVLTVAGGVPSWATPAGGGGKVLQVVQGTTTTATTIASTSFTDTTLSASITPSATTSKILVLFSQQYGGTRSAAEQGIGIQLLRGATSIYNVGAGGYETWYLQISGMTYFNFRNITTGVYLDSPSSTSSLTYKTQGKVNSTANSGSSTFNEAISTITLIEIGA